jgi:cytoskeletal protein RodZ
MSAPGTNVEEQKRKHRPALFGIRAVMGFAGVLLLALILWLAYQGQEPREAETRIDGRTGEEVQAE